MDPSIKRLLTQIVNVASVVSYNGPDEVLGPTRQIRAYVETRTAFSSAPNAGNDLANRTILIIEEQISLDDRIWLPGLNPSDLTASRQPMSVNFFYKENGSLDHCEVIL